MDDDMRKIRAASRHGDLVYLKQHVEVGNVCKKDYWGWQAIHYAAESGNLECVAWLVEKMGADVVKMPVYKTIEKECADVDFDYIDQVLFTSGSSVRAFIKRFGTVPENVKAYCLGLPTLTIAKENGIEAEVLPKD